MIETGQTKNKEYMEWIVKIEGQPLQRLLVRFMPITEKLEIVGQYKINVTWNTLYVDSGSMDISLNELQEIFFVVAKELQLRIKKHEELELVFQQIKLIEVPED